MCEPDDVDCEGSVDTHGVAPVGANGFSSSFVIVTHAFAEVSGELLSADNLQNDVVQVYFDLVILPSGKLPQTL